MPVNLDTELDALYQAPLADFVSQRNHLARALKQGGEKAEADRVGKLTRPTPVAWVLNQLHFRHRDVLGALLESGASLREAQEGLAPASEFAQRKRDHQQALRLATDAAVESAESAGMAMNAGLRRRIELSLTLVSTAGERAALGRMSAEPEPTGFDTFGAAELPAKAPPSAAETRDAAARKAAEEAARAAIAAIEGELARLDAEARAAHDRYEHAATEAADAEQRAEAARRTRDEARRESEAAKTRADEARGQLARQKKALDA